MDKLELLKMLYGNKIPRSDCCKAPIMTGIGGEKEHFFICKVCMTRCQVDDDNEAPEERMYENDWP